MARTKIAVIGDGAMGTTCALILAQQPSHEVCLWSLFSENIDQFRRAGENARFLPGVPIPDTVTLTADIDQALDRADLLVVAAPMVYLRDTLSGIASRFTKSRPAISIIKGIEQGTFLRASQVIREVLGERTVCALSGPSHAEELARGMPASIVSACDDLAFAKRVQGMFTTDPAARLHQHRHRGRGTGRGPEERARDCGRHMRRAPVRRQRQGRPDDPRHRGNDPVRRGPLGASAETFAGLTGIGDLIATCVSRFGRNRRVGEEIGRGRKLDEILADMHQVAEGIWTSRAVDEMADSMGVDMPITHEVCQVLFHGKNPGAGRNRSDAACAPARDRCWGRRTPA